MGFIRKVAKDPHNCRFPDNTLLDAGTIWQCDSCGKIYHLYKDYSINHRFPLLRWEHYDEQYYTKLHRESVIRNVYSEISRL